MSNFKVKLLHENYHSTKLTNFQNFLTNYGINDKYFFFKYFFNYLIYYNNLNIIQLYSYLGLVFTSYIASSKWKHYDDVVIEFS